jgi:hypothetical protein
VSQNRLNIHSGFDNILLEYLIMVYIGNHRQVILLIETITQVISACVFCNYINIQKKPVTNNSDEELTTLFL